MDEFLTVGEVAERLRVSKMTVYRMCQSGELPMVMVGKQYRIPAEPFERWLEDLTTKAVAAARGES
jgi:excisionase family DNA binding protein